jgi:hypothetical protein
MTELTQDIKPIYLGYDRLERKYYFYFIKEGAPRFLNYVSYFFWGKGPQNVLELSPIPEAVEIEMSEFLSGNLHYDFVKKRKNSTTTSARRLYRNPQDVIGIGEEKSVRKDGGKQASEGSHSGRGGLPTNGRVDGGSPSPVGVTPGVQSEQRSTIEKPKRHRRTKAEMEEARKSALPVSAVTDLIKCNIVKTDKLKKQPEKTVEVVVVQKAVLDEKPIKKRRVPKISK